MNILFQTYNKVLSTKVGTERTTVTVASCLAKRYGCKCFSIYEEETDSPKEPCFEKEFRWSIGKDHEDSIRKLREIIITNSIDCIIIQGAFIHVARFRRAIEGLKCKLIFAHHFEPGWEMQYFSFSHFRKLPGHPSAIGLLRWAKTILLFPVKKNFYAENLKALYREAYENADTTVLLSSTLESPYRDFSGLKDSSKFKFIPNGLSFDHSINRDEIKNKGRNVLIVSRLSDPDKKLSVALRIWAKVKRNPVAAGWVLKIVGGGEDEGLYRNIIRDENIPDVTLEGRQNPEPYYREASLFMMTSKSESWGLTLTESQQFGVVPIAFDSYPSLREIITDGENGFIIPNNDIDAYANKMLELMHDEGLRHEIALKALESSHRFSQGSIVEKWWTLITKQ